MSGVRSQKTEVREQKLEERDSWLQIETTKARITQSNLVILVKDSYARAGDWKTTIQDQFSIVRFQVIYS